MKFICSLSLYFVFHFTFSQDIAVLKYNGGDWYSNPTSLPNLIQFCNDKIHTAINKTAQTVEVGSSELYQYPFVHMTGHGNVFFTDHEAQNLRDYLISGGFLHVDDNYGMRPYFIEAIKKVFPNTPLVELAAKHPIFNAPFRFPNGLPKIHQHDGKRPQAFGITYKGRLVLLFTFESDLGDGWESPQVHHDPKRIREKALQMGANIIQYVFEH